MQFRSLLTLAAGLLIGALAHANDYKAGELRITQPYARSTVPGQPAGAAYITIENLGKATDRLVSASSPVAKAVEVHTMSMEGNLMKMREVPILEFKPSTKTVMKPGDGYHLMLMGLKEPLKAGDKFPLTLTFEKAGRVEVAVPVQGNMATGMDASAPQKHGH